MQKALAEPISFLSWDMKARREMLQSKGFSVLSGNGTSFVIEHKDLPGWIFKSAAKCQALSFRRGPKNENSKEAALIFEEEPILRVAKSA